MAGCTPKPAPLSTVAPQSRDECRLAADSLPRPETLTVVLTDPVDLRHALKPTNDSERLVFRQLLQTLVRLDCQGKVRPELAQSWSADSDGRVWTFTLRDGARFPEGTPLTAAHVSGTLALPDAKALGIDSAVELDDHRVRVRLREMRDTAPRLFAEPALAIRSGLASEAGPINRMDIPTREGRVPIEFKLAQNGDPRDAIDRGIDLAITRDPAVVEYVATRLEFATFPLPWSLTYVLLQPAGARPIDRIFDADSLRRSLARDAVRAEARPAEMPLWFDSLGACVARPVPGGEPTTSRVVYPSGDEAARGLAERIIALAGDPRLSAASLAPTEFATALREGAERAYVVPVPRQTLSPCRETTGWPAGSTVRPLIDTRATAIVRRGSPQLSVDWDGVIRVVADERSSGGSR